MWDTFMKSKIVRIGPLSDGNIYEYDPRSDTWLLGDEPVDIIPHEYEWRDGRVRLAYFDSDSHAWLDENYVILSMEASVFVNESFRKKYSINGCVKLMSLR
ncbi:MAG: hypothetical protein DRO99_01855 [Candidatus Aenigmatarchaeota archaeon]|nr:MAG: hypothetical protein DRO99_01855 [Candidatus Aenigmarchaeota archaeon]